MSLKQVLASVLLLTASILVKADYGSGSGNGYEGQGGQGNQNNQNGQPGAYNGGGYSNSWSQSNTGTLLLQTVSLIETATMVTTTTVMEPCATNTVGVATATSVSSPPSWGSSGSNSVQIVHVSDNSGTLAYSPENIVAEPGTIIEFIFYPKNHTVTQSSFAAPCVPIGVSTPDAVTLDNPGVRSGFVPIAANSTDFLRGIKPSFTMMVNDTNPIWLYCGQPGHCQKGMAMVINQNMSDTVKTLENYKIAAAQIPIPGAGATGVPGAAPSYGGAPPGAVTSTSTFTPPPPAFTSASAVTFTPAAITTVSTPTPASPSIASFTGAAAAPTAHLQAAAGALAVGLVILL